MQNIFTSLIIENFQAVSVMEIMSNIVRRLIKLQPTVASDILVEVQTGVFVALINELY